MTFHLRVAIFCVAAVPMAAQTFRGGINGSVEDASGAVLDNAKISAVNSATGFSRAVLTGSTGEFSIPDLPPGVYSVSALKPGFQEEKNNVEVVVSRVTSINFRLPVASQASTVMVSAEVASIETTSTTLTGVVNTQTVSDLPMNGRDFRQMLKLAPGPRRLPRLTEAVRAATITRSTAPITTTDSKTRRPSIRAASRALPELCFRLRRSISFRSPPMAARRWDATAAGRSTW